MSFRKEARSALDSKDFSQVITICEYGLEIDKNDHVLMMFKGLALKNLFRYREALGVLEQASKVAPDQLLVWKGFLDILNKVDDVKKRELVLTNLRRLSDNTEKTQYSFQLVNLLEDTKRYKDAAELLKTLSNEGVEIFQLNVRLIDLWRAWETEEIRILLEKERFRLSNDGIEPTTRRITSKVYSDSPLTELLITREGPDSTSLQTKEEIFTRLDVYCPNEFKSLNEQLIDQLKLSSKLAAKKYLERLDVSTVDEYPHDVLEFLADDFCNWILLKDRRIPHNSLSGIFQTFVYSFYLFAQEQFTLCVKFISSLSPEKPFGKKQLCALEKLKGFCLYRMGDYSECLNILVKFKEDNEEVLKALITSYDKLGKHDFAAVLLPTKSVERAWQLYKSRQLPQLEIELPLEKSNITPDWLVLKGLVLWHRGTDIPTALKLWQEALEQDDSFPLAFYYTGMYYLKQNVLPKSEANLIRAVELEKSNVEFVLLLSHLWVLMGKFKEVIGLLTTKRKNWKGHFYLGVSFENLCNFEDASISFLESLKQYRNDPFDDFLIIDEISILRHLAFCYHKCGKFKSALRAYMKLNTIVTEETDKLDIKLGLFEIFLQDSRNEEAFLIVQEIDSRLIKLNLIRRLTKSAIESFDWEIMGKLEKEVLGIYLNAKDSNLYELFFLADILFMLNIKDYKLECLEEELPRSIMKQSSDPSFLLCQLALNKMDSKSSRDPTLISQIDNLLMLLKDPTSIHLVLIDDDLVGENMFSLLNEAIVNSDKEKFERICLKDPAGCQGLAWIGRYLITKDKSFLFSAMENLRDSNWLKFCLADLLQNQRDESLFDNEMVFIASERLMATCREPWIKSLFGKLLERHCIIEGNEEILRDCFSCQNGSSAKDAKMVKVLLGQESGDLNLPLNQLTWLYQNDEDDSKAFDFMTTMNQDDTLPFTFSLQALVGETADFTPLIDFYKFPSLYQQWKWTKILYLSSKDPSKVTEFFKSITPSGLFPLFAALDILKSFPHDEVLKQAVKERKHFWQDVYEEVVGRAGNISFSRFYSKIGKRFYDQIVEIL